MGRADGDETAGTPEVASPASGSAGAPAPAGAGAAGAAERERGSSSGLLRLWHRLMNIPRSRFADPLVYWRAQALRNVIVFSICSMILSLPILLIGVPIQSPLAEPRVLSSICAILVGVVSFWLAGRGALGLAIAGWIIVPGYLFGAVLGALNWNGIIDPWVLSSTTGILVAALLVGARGALLIGGALSLEFIWLGWSSLNRWALQGLPQLTLLDQRATAYALFNTVLFMVVVVVQWDAVHKQLLRDAVERARAEQSALARQDALATFMSAVSHEMASPLTVAKAYLQMAMGHASKAHGDLTHLCRVEPALLRLEKMIKDLGAAARVEGPAFTIDGRPCDLAPLCRQVSSEHEVAMNRPIAVVLPEEPITILGDEDRLRQVVGNLLANACKYVPVDRRVEVSLSRSAGEALLRVRDEGPGIAEEHRALLFQRFYRVPGVRPVAGSQTGLGLGLYVCRELVERHGGRIWVESALGEGTSFFVALPLHAPAL